ncbi:MAG: methyl-accepting chemotaxis protein [Magnetospirillum sp.]|nr:methyl-accepting chemotaxis protein [Magnetospirillum sp.]
MQGILARFPLKVQIGAIVAVAVLIFAIVAAVVFVNASAQSRLAGQAAQADQLKDDAAALAFSLLDARRREKDFLAQRNDDMVAAHGRSLAAAFDRLGALEASTTGGDAQAIRTLARAYADGFAQVVATQRTIGFSENDGLMGSLRASVHQVEEALKSHDELRLAVLMLQMRRHEKDFLARRDAKYQAEMTKRADEFAAVLNASALPAAVRDGIAAKMAAYHRDFAAVVEGTLRLSGETARLSDLYAQMEPRVEALARDAGDRARSAAAESRRVDGLTWRAIAAALALGTGALVVLGALIARGVYGPLTRMADAMRRLATGEREVEVPSRERADEVGAMARALQVFKDNAAEAERLRTAQEQERTRAEAEKLVALRAMADTVERETRSAVDRVAERTGHMQDDAVGMASSAQLVSANSQDVAAAAAQALANAQNVASASEQLSASIGEITQQVGTAGGITRRAVESVLDAQHTMAQLTEAVAHIGEVAQIISGIAAQTNLLALNATIEAARAGDAGKGFAVVAGEVKALATQTSRATEEISGQIDTIQGTTRHVEAAVSAIAQSIRDVDGMSSAIAAAIEQQGAATAEIARNVTQTSDAALEVSNRIATVSGEAASTGERAATVRSVSTDVAEAIDQLRHALVRTVRTATREVDRRALPRYRVNAAATVRLGSEWAEATIQDCSEGGVTLLAGTLSLGLGQRVSLSAPLLGDNLPAEVVELEHGHAHLHFRLDGEEQERFADRFRLAVAGMPVVAA